MGSEMMICILIISVIFPFPTKFIKWLVDLVGKTKLKNKKSHGLIAEKK